MYFLFLVLSIYIARIQPKYGENCDCKGSTPYYIENHGCSSYEPKKTLITTKHAHLPSCDDLPHIGDIGSNCICPYEKPYFIKSHGCSKTKILSEKDKEHRDSYADFIY